MKCVGRHISKSLAVISGDPCHTHTPGVVEHERTVDEVHDNGDIGILVAAEQRQGRGPVIVDDSDVFPNDLLIGHLLGLGSEVEVRVCGVNPLPPLRGQPVNLEEQGHTSEVPLPI